MNRIIAIVPADTAEQLNDDLAELNGGPLFTVPLGDPVTHYWASWPEHLLPLWAEAKRLGRITTDDAKPLTRTAAMKPGEIRTVKDTPPDTVLSRLKLARPEPAPEPTPEPVRDPVPEPVRDLGRSL